MCAHLLAKWITDHKFVDVLRYDMYPKSFFEYLTRKKKIILRIAKWAVDYKFKSVLRHDIYPKLFFKCVEKRLIIFLNAGYVFVQTFILV